VGTSINLIGINHKGALLALLVLGLLGEAQLTGEEGGPGPGDVPDAHGDEPDVTFGARLSLRTQTGAHDRGSGGGRKYCTHLLSS